MAVELLLLLLLLRSRAVELQILTFLLALPGQTIAPVTINDNSSLSTGRYVFPEASEYVPTKFNNDSSTSNFGVSEITRSSVSTAASDVETSVVSDNIPTTTEAADNTMHTDNVASESVPGQADHNTRHTDNVVSESVPGQTDDNTMFSDNVASENVSGQAADNTMHIGNIASESVPGQADENTRHTDNVASESVPGQADDNTMHTDNGVSESVPGQTDDNTMHTDNGVSESVPGQSADNTMHTDNGVSESVPGQADDNTVHTDSVVSVMDGATSAEIAASESVRGQADDNTVHTDSVVSVMDGAISAETAASESVRGQAADSHSVRSTTSAMNSGLGETVTAASESIDPVDTVSDSVRTANDSDDITAETVFTSKTVTTVPITVIPLVTNSPVTPTDDCDDWLCEKAAGYFVINTTACLPKPSPIFQISIPTTVEILTNENRGSTDIMCEFYIIVLENHYLNLTIDPPVLGEAALNGTQSLAFDIENEYEYNQTFDMSVLRNKTVTFTSTTSLYFRFRSHGLLLTSSVTFHFLVQRGAPLRDLPTVQLTDTVGYVTSPRFDGLDLRYSNSYDGVFHLHVSDNESVLISFPHFDLEFDTDCVYDYLQFTLTAFNRMWTKCGVEDVPTRVYRSSVHLLFHADSAVANIGFKMMYAILPRSEEPEQLSDNVYNCSVPHFHSFKPLLSCNMLTECQENEDEQNCSYHSDDCGEGALDEGTKCYRFVRPGGTTTWSDAEYECTRANQHLVTLATPDEVRRFRQAMSWVKNHRRVYIGAQLEDRVRDAVAADALYRHLFRWVDGRTALFIDIVGVSSPPQCAYYNPATGRFRSESCQGANEADLVCEFDKRNGHSQNETKAELGSSVSITDPEDAVWNVSVVQCPLGHVTRDFLSCDAQGQCGAKDSMTSCHSGSVTVPMFLCERSQAAVHYTLVCDHIQHCADNTDEVFCEFPPCPFSWFRCQNGQCVTRNQLCDIKSDCYDGSDEVCRPQSLIEFNILPPAVIDLDGRGQPFVRRISDSDDCPLTHFRCSLGFCLPVYLRCNDVDDCPGREDEASCDSYTCSGFYRCRGSTVCLHPDHVCDGVLQCPQYDDELLCEKLPCPDVCQCQGLAYVCTANFSASSYPALRYLDASGSTMTPNDLTRNYVLIYLRLSDCRMDTMPSLELVNLRHLDISWNELTHVDMQHFHSLKNLRVLVLSGNPLSVITNPNSWGPDAMVLRTIDLSGTSLDVFNGSALAGCPDLRALNVSWSKLTTITKEGFRSTPLLENLDVRGSPLKDFPSDLLRGLVSLKVVQADNYKLCCEAMLPEDFDLNKCHAEQDLLASCDDLLKSNVYRVFLWIFASLAVAGNVGSFVARLYLGNRGAGLGSFNVFVSGLSIADFCMGVYLAIIGVADQIYRGKYLWYGDQWKESAVCSVAGFLSLVSSEVSAFTICLITLDRFLALRFPFSRLHFSRRSAMVACTIVWMVGISLATVPLLPMTSHWEFYSQTGICIPLPFTTSERFQGYDYSFSVVIVLNSALFLLIAVGQAFIYWSVRSNSISSSKTTGSRDATIARRLTTIVVSDFLCWFPIGLLGLLASTGTPIPGELNVAVAIFVLPLNSALNPFLYTFNVLREKRRKAQEAYLLKRLETRMYTEQSQGVTALKISLPVNNRSTAMGLVKTWLSEQVLTQEDIVSCSASGDDGTGKDFSQ